MGSIGALAAGLAVGAILTSAATAAPRTPTSTASGTLRIAWQDESSGLTSSSRSEGVVTYAIHGRLRHPADAESWVPGETPSYTDATRWSYGSFLRASASVERYTRTWEVTCDGGGMARVTTVATGVPRPNALLMVNHPTVNLPRRTGELDLDLAFAVDQEGIRRFGQTVFASGIARVRETGTWCASPDESGNTQFEAVDREYEGPIHHLFGFDVAAAFVDGYESFPLRITSPAGEVAVRVSKPLHLVGGERGKSLSGTVDIDLRLGGPLRAQDALCEIPSRRLLSRVQTLARARAMLARYGFPRVAYGGIRRSPQVRRPGFELDVGSSLLNCGRPLGTRRHPVLFLMRPGRSALSRAGDRPVPFLRSSWFPHVRPQWGRDIFVY